MQFTHSHVLYRIHDQFHVTHSKNKMCTVMDSFLKRVFVRAGKHTSVHNVHAHDEDDFETDRSPGYVKSASRPGYVAKVLPWIKMKKLFDWH